MEKQLERHSREDLLFDLPSADELNNEELSNRPPFISAAGRFLKIPKMNLIREAVVRFMEPLFDCLKSITRKEGNVELVAAIFKEVSNPFRC